MAAERLRAGLALLLAGRAGSSWRHFRPAGPALHPGRAARPEPCARRRRRPRRRGRQARHDARAAPGEPGAGGVRAGDHPARRRWFDLWPAIAGLGLVGAAITLAGQSIVLDYLMGVLILARASTTRATRSTPAPSRASWRRSGCGARCCVTRAARSTRSPTAPSGTVSNLTRIYAAAVVDIPGVRQQDIEATIAVMNRVGEELAADPDWSDRILDTPRYVSTTAFTDLGATLRMSGRVKPGDRWAVPAELRRRLGPALMRRRRGAVAPQRHRATARLTLPRRPAGRGRRRRIGRMARASTHHRRRTPTTVTAEQPAQPGAEIENLMGEGQSFPPSPAFAAQANATRRSLRRRGGRLRGLLGGPRAGAPGLERAVPHHARVGPAVREVVRGRQAQRERELRRPARRATAWATRSPTTGSASPATPARSPTATCCARSRRPPTRSRSWASAPATASPSTCP